MLRNSQQISCTVSEHLVYTNEFNQMYIFQTLFVSAWLNNQILETLKNTMLLLQNKNVLVTHTREHTNLKFKNKEIFKTWLHK